MTKRGRTAAGALGLLLGLLLGPWGAAPAAAKDGELEHLPPQHRQWLEDVRWLIAKEERKEFLALDKDHQRDAFIRRFWEARDPYPDTGRNEFREAWYARLDYARDTYGNTNEDRARILILQGPPDVSFEFECEMLLWPIEVWGYEDLPGRAGAIYLIFYQPRRAGPYELWQGTKREGLAALFSEPAEVLEGRCDDGARRSGDDRVLGRSSQSAGVQSDISIECAAFVIRRRCAVGKDPLAEALIDALFRAAATDRFTDYAIDLARLEDRPEPREEEWLATFRSYSTDLPEGAATFELTPSIRFPRREGGRTVVRIELPVPAGAIQAVDLEGRRSYDFSLTGEVLRDGELFESFRYRFDAPADGTAGDQTVPLIFQRLLRPGDFRLVLKLEDLHGGAHWRDEIDLRVPEAPEAPAAAPGGGAEAGALAALLGGAGGAGGAGEPARIELRGPGEGVVTGMTRFDARVIGEAASVTFYLDGRRVMSKTRPPYSLELDLGPVPRPHTVRAVAFDAAGNRLALDEVDLNAGEHRFAVRLTSPRNGDAAAGPTEVRVELAVPEGERLDRLELYVGERPVATLYQEPYLLTVDLPREPVYVRAVAYLADGASREAVAFVNVPDPVEEIRVELVEVYASVLDGSGRPVGGLARDGFRVVEDGVEQEVVRFEQVTDRPLSVVLMVDSSASMAERIDAVRTAAAGFLARTLTPADRAAVVAFSDRAVQDVDLTGDLEGLTAGLAALDAERGTALYDNLVSVLYHLNGVQGQRAILLLSDGEDRSSSYTFAEAREFARAAGVAIYPIGLALPKTDLVVRRELSILANESGGRSFFVDDVAELDAVYAAIESELRSKYLLVYQSTGSGSDFRSVDVAVEGRGLEVKAMRGYYP